MRRSVQTVAHISCNLWEVERLGSPGALSCQHGACEWGVDLTLLATRWRRLRRVPSWPTAAAAMPPR